MSSKDDLSDCLPSQLGFEDLVKEANAGNPAALAQLRKTLDENQQIWRAVGNLALHARMVLVDCTRNSSAKTNTRTLPFGRK